MPADILIYALVAAGLVFWLRSVLGTRHGDERQRPNPFTTPPPGTADNPNTVAGAVPGATQVSDAQVLLAEAIALPKDARYALSAPDAEATLTNLARQDRSFHLGRFLRGVEDAFVMIVEAFAAGDKDLLKSLLSPNLYSAFEKAIVARDASGETMMTEIHALRRIEINAIQLIDKNVEVTLRIIADETSVTKDKDGKIISGNPDRASETIDIWTLTRNLKSKDPTWFLQATREEHAEEKTDTPSSAPDSGV